MPNHRLHDQARERMLALVITLCVSGCLDRELEPLNPCLVSGVVAEVAVENVDKVDLLFVVDNSQSMAEEQAALRREFPKLIRVLTTGERLPLPSFAPAQDLHLGVVSSDLGLVGVTGVPGCEGLGDDGLMNDVPSANISGCQPTYPRFLSYLSAVDTPERTATDFACLADLGTDGCGFEQQLEAALKALWPSVDVDRETGTVLEPNRVRFLGDAMGFGQLGHGDIEHEGFLRNDPQNGLSVVAVVVVTDEEDCSSADTSHFTPELFLDPSDPLASQDLNLRCHFNPQNLYELQRYVNGYKALRAGRENLVLFAAIAGVPPDLVDEKARAEVDFSVEADRDAFYGQILADPRMQETVDTSRPPGEGNLLPSCSTENGVAFPPIRIVQVAEEFGEQGIVQSICQDDFGPSMDAIIELIAVNLVPVCLPRALVRDADGLVGCNVVWELPAPRTAPVGTPTSCADRSYLSVPTAGRKVMTDEGGEVCVVHQLAVVGAAYQQTDGSSEGWYYDDFSADLQHDCSAATPQRIAFTPGASPGSGVVVKLECLDETQRLANNRTDLLPTAHQPTIGDKCDEIRTPQGQVLTGDAACVVTLRDNTTDHAMFCHPALNVCVLRCSTDAECPPAWVCDSRDDTRATAGQSICVNPTCGDL